MSGGRGAGDRPLTYAGAYDATRTYLPREVVTYSGTAYLAIARVTGVLPSVTASWIPLGGGGDSEHNGTGSYSTAVGTSATASTDASTALGDFAESSGAGVGGSTSIGAFGRARGQYSTAVGAAAHADNDQSIAIGGTARALSNNGIAIGYQSLVFDADDNIAIGNAAGADTQTSAIAIGTRAHASHAYSLAIGYSAITRADFCAALHFNQVEAAPASSTDSFFVVTDSTGVRWKIGVDPSGAVTTALA